MRDGFAVQAAPPIELPVLKKHKGFPSLDGRGLRGGCIIITLIQPSLIKRERVD